jgi:DNA polymerase-3 subunit alpha
MHDFVHLRVHSEFSVTEGILRIKNLIKLAEANQMPALALSDHHNMFGLVKFYKLCREKGIKPIIGSEVNVQGKDFNYQLILLAKNLAGYRQICDWISRSYVQNKILDVPHIKEEWLQESPNKDVVLLSGGVFGDLAEFIKQRNYAAAKAQVLRWKESFGDDYFIELQRTEKHYDDDFFNACLQLANECSVAVVATHPVQFATSDDYLAHEVRVCVADGAMLDDGNRQSKFSPDQYLKSMQEMSELFSDLPTALHNSMEIAKKCNLEITLGKYFLPDFATPENQPLEEYLSLLSNQGLEQRMKELFPDEVVRNENLPTYQARLEL